MNNPSPLPKLISLAVSQALAAHTPNVSPQPGFLAKLGLSLVATLVAALCVIAALACTMAALWCFLLPHIGPVGAPLIVAAVLLLIAIITLVALRPHQAKAAPPAALPVDALVDEALVVFKKNKTAWLLGAVLAGLASGL